MPKKFYSVKEASKILGVSTNTIYKYLDEGSLKGRRLNNRGRFKIPFSEIAPYLAGEAELTADTIEKAQADKKDGPKLSFFELWFGVALVGLILIYFLGNKSSLLTDIGNATLGYSGRTFSGFGSLVSRVLPAQKSTNEAQAPNEIVSGSLMGIVREGDTPDLNYKIQDTEARTYELYVNAQVLASSTQRLLGKSRTLTSAELNDAINEMSQLTKTIFAEINWLGETWDFSTIEAIKRTASQVTYILDSLQKQSLGAFTKPELTDLNNLVSEAELLQGLVGNTSDTGDEKTLYGSIKEAKALAQALDVKSQEIDKILGSWDSYTIFEKEDTIKSILSNSLSLNILPKVDEIIFSKLPSEGSDTELKNSLLSVKGVLAANKTYLAQKAGQPVVVTWLEWGGSVLKTLAVNPSALIPQEANFKYYLPAEVKKEQVGQVDVGLKLNFDSQRHQYYIEGSVPLAVSEMKTISLKVGDTRGEPELLGAQDVSAPPSKPAAVEEKSAISQEAAAPISLTPQMGRVERSIAIWGSAIIFFSALAFLVIYLAIYLKTALAGRNNKSKQKETPEFQSEDKPNVDKTVAMPTSTYNMSSEPLVKFHAITKVASSIIGGLLKVPVSILTFFSKMVSLVRNLIVSTITGLTSLIVSIVTSLKRGFGAVIHAITTLFSKIISVIARTTISIKTGLVAILVSVATFFLKLLASIKKFFISLVTGLAKLIALVIHAITKAISAITTALLKIPSSITAFFRGVVSSIVNFIAAIAFSLRRGFYAVIHAITKVIISIKTGLLKMLISIKTGLLTIIASITKVVVSIATFFSRALSLTVKLIASVAASLRQGFYSIIHAVTAFLVSIVSAITKAIISIKAGLLAILTSIKTVLLTITASIVAFFLRVTSLIKELLVSAITALVKLIASVAVSLRQGFRDIAHAITTFWVKIISFITKALISIKTGLLTAIASITTFFLEVLSSTTKAIISNIKRLLKVLVSITKFVDSVLLQQNFQTPTFPRPELALEPVHKFTLPQHLNFRRIAVVLLVGITSAVVSAVLALKLMSFLKIDSQNVLGEESSGNESMILAKDKKITIKETDTGWLRVRSIPGGSEIGKVYPGETFELLQEKDGWFLIEGEEAKSLPAGRQGWVSSRYAFYE
ncbi:hypothetical protein A2614_00400 [Candidatus Woesebacteria bacterium RIFOXYD1_FULL_40_21]|uniref:Helix-turn-helix domain-containing protein n=1 Tax=Candidatus Woesebacteria bacterium RIFOXYD1_FULL_40_21 TaxID=1802549 RepID=A0A1F8DI81_9BACT|nr:MAG: hypothetical protein A2614_00400 [Candidatus Woesebacteria bacterium RIFOXYD1_FULL_40_21]